MAVITAVYPNTLQTQSSSSLAQCYQEQFSTIAVLNASRRDHNPQQQPNSIDCGLTFAGLDLFASIITSDASRRGRQYLQGLTIGGFGLTLTVEDLTKFGYLYLHHGQWADQQLVSTAYAYLNHSPERGRFP